MDLQFASHWEHSDHLDYASTARLTIAPKLYLQPRQEAVPRFNVGVEGAAGAGKTQLITLLLGEKPCSEYQPTHGIAVHQVTVEFMYSGRLTTCVLNLWEYGTYYSRKYEYVQETTRPQDATVYVLSILDRDSFTELLTQKSLPSPYLCVYLSKTDLSLQTNVFPQEIQQLQRDVFIEARTMLLHLCGRLLQGSQRT